MNSPAPQAPSTGSPTASTPAPSGSRLASLDVFRGLVIAFMIIVNTPGHEDVAWTPLRHAPWHGFTPTDLVFPSFLFIIGVSAFFSLRRFNGRPGREGWVRIWRRTAVLFLIGMLMWYVPGLLVSVFSGDFAAQLGKTIRELRIPGVLQRLALCYGIGSTLVLLLSRRALIGAAVVFLLAYWAALGLFETGGDPYALQTNAVLRLDLWLMGPAHLYHGERVGGVPFAFDPEGLLSTLPAVVTFILGYLAAAHLHATSDRRHALSNLFPAAALLIAAGFLWDYWLGFPINKKLWTSSYTLFVGGLSMGLLAMTVWCVDVKGWRRVLTPLEIFGRNPLTAYLTSELGVVLLAGMIHVSGPQGQSISAFEWIYRTFCVPVAGDTGAGSFLFSVGYCAANWVVALGMYRCGWILKA